MDRTDAARFLGGIPKQRRYQRTCPICGKQFTATARGVYCSPPCTAKAQRQREKAKQQEAVVSESPASN